MKFTEGMRNGGSQVPTKSEAAWRRAKMPPGQVDLTTAFDVSLPDYL